MGAWRQGSARRVCAGLPSDMTGHYVAVRKGYRDVSGEVDETAGTSIDRRCHKRDDGVCGASSTCAGLPTDSARVGLDESQREASLTASAGCCRRQVASRSEPGCQEIANYMADASQVCATVEWLPHWRQARASMKKKISVTLSAFLSSVLSANTPHPQTEDRGVDGLRIVAYRG